jgi:integrase
MSLNERERRDVRARLTGLHTATKRLADGRACIYAYAYRGGRMIAKGVGPDLAAARKALETEMGKAATLRKLEEARRAPSEYKSRHFVDGLVTAFLASPEYARLRPSTKAAYRTYLDAFRRRFPDFKVEWFERDAIVDLIEWRDELGKHPRKADYTMQAVSRLFGWARSKAYTQAEPTKNIESLHRSNRSEMIWTDTDLARLFDHCSPSLRHAVELAALTGLRLGDLVRLTWGDVGQESVTVRTSKRGSRVVIPLLDESKALIERIGRRDVGVVLTNTRGKPWTPDGLKTSFLKAKAAAGIEGLRFHDLRGTAATRFKVFRLSDDRIASIMGWSKESVQALMLRYVSADAVAIDMLREIRERTGADKPGHKPVLTDATTDPAQTVAGLGKRAPSSAG